MYLEQESIDEFGHTLSKLSPNSSLKIKLRCDYCGSIYDSSPKRRKIGNSVINKDACIKCRYKKRDDIGIAKYGVTNPFARKEVKDKIKSGNLNKYGVEYYTQTKEFAEKAEATNIKCYGVKNAMLNSEIQQRQSDSIYDKYGVKNISQLQITKDKVKNTCLTKYGSEAFLSSEYAQEQIKKTNLDKYGVENVFANKDIQEKIKKTNIENLGVEYPTQSPEIMEKIKNIVNIKYGVENIAQLDEVKQKMKFTNITKYGFAYPSQSEFIKEKIYNTKVKNGYIKLYDSKTMKELSEELDRAYSTFVVQVRNYGIDSALNMKNKENGLEKIIELILIKNNISYYRNKYIEGRQYDFLLFDYNIVIETDGLFWHSDKVIKDNNYHKIKREHYIKYGYRPLFFREDEIIEKLSIVESIILNACKKSSIIFARKCELDIIDTRIGNDFLDKNHLMGYGKGVNFILKHDNEIISCLQIKRINDKNYEISRFCNKLGFTITGGFSRLLKFAQKNLQMQTLTTYIDLRYGLGDYLKDFGFVKNGSNLSFKWTSQYKTYHRMKFPGNSGYEHGLAKIWDCGQVKWIKTYS